MRHCVHFVGFSGDEYLSAVRAFGEPDFIHRGWDLRARREIADGDLVVFAKGEYYQEPRHKSYDDIREQFLDLQPALYRPSRKSARGCLLALVTMFHMIYN